MRVLLLVIVLLSALTVNAQNGQYPPSGVYIGLNQDFLYNLGQDFTNNLVNNLTNYPFQSISGSSGSISYTFSSFKLALILDDFYYLQGSANGYELGWQNTQFELQWNYHICDNTVFHPCEDGYIQVFTTGDNQTVTVATDVTIDFDSTTTSIQATGTYMVFDQGAVQINVQCTNTICVIPVDDIANSVAQNFVTEATTTITDLVNSKASDFAGLLNPIKKLPYSIHGEDYFVDYEGQIVESSTANSFTPTMTLAVNGGIIVQTTYGQFIYPTQQPSYIPADYLLENFTSDYLMTFTPFFFESLIDAAFDSEFPFLITPQMDPSSSPVTLNTSDPFFNQSCPELTGKYPDQPISINLHDPVTPVVTIYPNGLLVLNGTVITGDFTIDYQGDTLDVFSIDFTIDMELQLVLAVDGSNIQANVSLVSFTPNATLASTIVGDVEMMGFVQILQLMQTVIKIPSFAYPVPAGYTIETFTYETESQILQLFVDLSKNDLEVHRPSHNKLKAL